MTIRTIELVDATQSLATYIQDIATGPLVLTINGQPVAALVALDNADLETITLSQDPAFLALIEQSRERQQREGGLSSDELRRRLGLSAHHA
jgi:antitoxin (DNA-binding transcriptional repressor) of toxin-antitoxin stability system